MFMRARFHTEVLIYHGELTSDMETGKRNIRFEIVIVSHEKQDPRHVCLAALTPSSGRCSAAPGPDTHGADAGSEPLLQLVHGDHVLVEHQLLLQIVHRSSALLGLLVPRRILLAFGLKRDGSYAKQSGCSKDLLAFLSTAFVCSTNVGLNVSFSSIGSLYFYVSTFSFSMVSA